MAQADFIKDIAKYGLENDQDRLLASLNELIDHAKKSKKINFALQLQSILKESIRQHQTNGLLKVGSPLHQQREDDREVNEFILEKLTSDYQFDSLVCTDSVKEELGYFIKEHQALDVLHKFGLPVSNRVLFYGPSGCGKTLASYVLAGELEKLMLVVNLGAIVSSKLGETSKNLAKVFRRAAAEECIVFIDEFDTLGKVRDYSQDHGEMKRVVNTLLQLFDYLPSSSVIIAATNQISMIDEALLRRFDVRINLELPDERHITELIYKTLKSGLVELDQQNDLAAIVNSCKGLSYYGIQRTLITAIKRSVIAHPRTSLTKPRIDTDLWLDLVRKEKQQFSFQ